MADWSKPTLTSTYTAFVTEVKDRDVEAALWFEGMSPTNLPTNAKRLNTSTGRFEKWSGTAWVDAVATFTFPALTVAGAATFNGNTTIGDAGTDTLTVNAAATFAAGVTFSGAATFNGGVTLGDAAADAVTVNGTLSFATAPVLTPGTANGVLFLNGSKVLTSSSALQFNGSSLGMGGAPSPWYVGAAAIETPFAFVSGRVQTHILCNAYYDTSFKLIGAGRACMYFAEASSGRHSWHVSPAAGVQGGAISFVQAMTLDENGRRMLGTTVPSNIAGYMTDTINGPSGSYTEWQQSNGNTFRVGSDSSAGGFIFTQALLPIRFGTNGLERLRLDPAGNAIAESGVTGYWQIPRGTTAQRPIGASGMIRFNTSLSRYEGHNGSAWASIGGGATGGGSDDVFHENGQTVTTNYTLTSGKNAMSAGPITISSGITVTVPLGSNWAIV